MLHLFDNRALSKLSTTNFSGVQPGTSWGSLTVEGQKRWHELRCDRFAGDKAGPVCALNSTRYLIKEKLQHAWLDRYCVNECNSLSSCRRVQEVDGYGGLMDHIKRQAVMVRLLKILVVFSQAPEHKEHMTWVAGAGTLLGVLRHGGFIPWDHDIDVYVTQSSATYWITCLSSRLTSPSSTRKSNPK